MPKLTDRGDLYPDGYLALTVAQEEVPCSIGADIQVNSTIHKGVEISLNLLLFDGSQFPSRQARPLAQEYVGWGKREQVFFRIGRPGTYYVAWKGSRYVRDALAWMNLTEIDRLMGFANTFNMSDWEWSWVPDGPQLDPHKVAVGAAAVDLTATPPSSAASAGPSARVPGHAQAWPAGGPGSAPGEESYRAPGGPAGMSEGEAAYSPSGVGGAGQGAFRGEYRQAPGPNSAAPYGGPPQGGAWPYPPEPKRKAGCLKRLGCLLLAAFVLAGVALVVLALYGPDIAEYLGIASRLGAPLLGVAAPG